MLIQRHEHLCQVRPTVQLSLPDTNDILNEPPMAVLAKVESGQSSCLLVQNDPHSILSDKLREEFATTNQEFDAVFSAGIGCYNNYSGKFTHVINMGASLPPQRRGRVPFYGKDNMDILQNKFDQLRSEGVFAKPEELNITAEYVSPSFLIAKSSGGHRLVFFIGLLI